MKTTDIIIVGAGTVGCTLAAGLTATTNLEVSLIDANSPEQVDSHLGFDARVIALSKRTVDEFSRFGVPLENANGVPINDILVSDQGYLGQCRLKADDFNVPYFGKVVSLAALGQCLLPTVTAQTCLYAPDSVVEVTRTQDNVVASLASGEQLKGKLLVLADGGRSPLSDSLGFTRQVDDYHQTAIICNINTSQPHNGFAHERFTQHGPLALLPFNLSKQEHHKGNGYSVVWTVATDRVESMMDLSDTDFMQAMQQEAGYRHGMITEVSTRYTYPLLLQRVTQVDSHRTVVIGNGAQTLHPIAGQGFNLGLRDAVDLVNVVAQHQNDPGAFAATLAYRQSRAADRHVTISLTDSLVRLFSNRHLPLVIGRNLGLVAMDCSGMLSRRFVKQTMGFGSPQNTKVV